MGFAHVGPLIMVSHATGHPREGVERLRREPSVSRLKSRPCTDPVAYPYGTWSMYVAR